MGFFLCLIMPTKSELEAEIERCKQTIRDQENALKKLSEKKGMVIALPVVPHAVNRGDAPYVFMEGDSTDEWSKRFHPFVVTVLKEYGIPNSLLGVTSAGSVDLGEGHFSRGDCVVVPKKFGEILLALMNEAAHFGQVCYSAGITEGTNLLKQLANDDLTVEKYEHHLALEKAIGSQKHKRYKMKKYG